MKPYIEFNIQKRIEVAKNGDKDGTALHKLMNNTIYVKMMENLRNRIDVRNKKKEYLKCTSKPSYMLYKIFDNKQVTDTDSLMYEIKTEDVYKDFSCGKEMYDFNDYLGKLESYDDSN